MPRFGQRRSGKWGSTVRLSGGVSGGVVVVRGGGDSRARVSKGLVQLFYRRTGEEEELGVTQRREAQPRKGCGKGEASPVRRGSAIGNRRPRGARELAVVGYGAGQIAGSRRGQRLVEACWGFTPWYGLPRQASSARWPAAATPRGTEQGRGEERERERRAGIPIKFSQNFEQKLEKL
jgi:hypothetical protein